MRPKIVIIILTLGLFVLGTLFAIRNSTDRSTRSSEPQPTASATTQPSDALASAKTDPTPVVASPKNSTQSEIQPTNSSADAHQAYVEQRSTQLMDIAMTDDRANLDTILSEMSNRDPEIRKAALEATIQFGSRDAIPKLADAISQTDDPNEKAAIADAIEFLKLPSLTEIRAQSSSRPAANNTTAAPKPARRATLARRVQSAPPPNNQ
jgi:hypothetical protein